MVGVCTVLGRSAADGAGVLVKKPKSDFCFASDFDAESEPFAPPPFVLPPIPSRLNPDPTPAPVPADPWSDGVWRNAVLGLFAAGVVVEGRPMLSEGRTSVARGS